MGEEGQKATPNRHQHPHISYILNALQFLPFQRDCNSFGGGVEHYQLIFSPTIYRLFGQYLPPFLNYLRRIFIFRVDKLKLHHFVGIGVKT